MGDAETGKGIAMHVAAFNPVAVNAEAFLLTLSRKRKKLLKQKQLNLVSLQTSLKNGTGSVEKYLNEVALDRQMYVIDNDKKVADVLKATGTNVVQFVRFEVVKVLRKS
jgi:elongation factor Ts